MRIDSSFTQPAQQLAAPAQREGPGEVENDGDADDGAQGAARARSTQQAWGMWGQGVGTKIDLMA